MEELQPQNDTASLKLQEVTPSKSKLFSRFFWVAIFVSCLLFFVYYIFAPSSFPQKSFLKVEQGTSIFKLTQDAEALHLVRSARVLQIAIILFHGEHSVSYGDYYFDQPLSVIEVARRLSQADFHVEPIRVTLTEGMTRLQMADVLSKSLPRFNTGVFLEETKEDEGYLFPDTYFISPNATTADVIVRLKKNFTSKINSIQDMFLHTSLLKKDVVTLASLVEKEASGDSDRAIIAGILLNRLNQGMRLQVDASFLFLLNKKSSDVTISDLAMDSPYNTYKYAGLPPGPIGNPGLSSIKAVLTPIQTEYLFYLHDPEGGVHYAKNFTEHKRNKALYLK